MTKDELDTYITECCVRGGLYFPKIEKVLAMDDDPTIVSTIQALHPGEWKIVRTVDIVDRNDSMLAWPFLAIGKLVTYIPADSVILPTLSEEDAEYLAHVLLRGIN